MRPWIATGLAVAAVTLLGPSGAAAATAPSACPATFSVLHDDRIGPLAVPAGPYQVTIADPSRLTCAAASDAFRLFLEDFDGRLPAPWTLDPATSTFTGANGAAFSIVPAAAPSGGGGGGGGQFPAGGTRCPGVVQVQHDDRIGRFRVPAGDYTLTLLSVGPLSCGQVVSRFLAFLSDFDGVLPAPWLLDPVTGTFLQGSAWAGFRIAAAVNPAPGPVNPASGRRCPGTFRVQHDDRIGALRLPKGAYTITLGRSGQPSCATASRALARFLQAPSGRLPSPWKLNAASATFSTGSGASFAVKPAR